MQRDNYIPPYSKQFVHRTSKIQENREKQLEFNLKDPFRNRDYGSLLTVQADESKLHHSNRTFGLVRPLSVGRYRDAGKQNNDNTLGDSRSLTSSGSTRRRCVSAERSRTMSDSSQQPLSMSRNAVEFNRALQKNRDIAAERKIEESLQQVKKEAYVQYLKDKIGQAKPSWIPSGDGPKHAESLHKSINRTGSEKGLLQKAWRRSPWPGLVASNQQTVNSLNSSMNLGSSSSLAGFNRHNSDLAATDADIRHYDPSDDNDSNYLDDRMTSSRFNQQQSQLLPNTEFQSVLSPTSFGRRVRAFSSDDGQQMPSYLRIDPTDMSQFSSSPAGRARSSSSVSAAPSIISSPLRSSRVRKAPAHVALTVRLINAAKNHSSKGNAYGILMVPPVCSRSEFIGAIERQFNVFDQISDISIASKYGYSGVLSFTSLSLHTIGDTVELNDTSEVNVYLGGTLYQEGDNNLLHFLEEELTQYEGKYLPSRATTALSSDRKARDGMTTSKLTSRSSPVAKDSLLGSTATSNSSNNTRVNLNAGATTNSLPLQFQSLQQIQLQEQCGVQFGRSNRMHSFSLPAASLQVPSNVHERVASMYPTATLIGSPGISSKSGRDILATLESVLAEEEGSASNYQNNDNNSTTNDSKHLQQLNRLESNDDDESSQQESVHPYCESTDTDFYLFGMRSASRENDNDNKINNSAGKEGTRRTTADSKKQIEIYSTQLKLSDLNTSPVDTRSPNVQQHSSKAAGAYDFYSSAPFFSPEPNPVRYPPTDRVANEFNSPRQQQNSPHSSPSVQFSKTLQIETKSAKAVGGNTSNASTNKSAVPQKSSSAAASRAAQIHNKILTRVSTPTCIKKSVKSALPQSAVSQPNHYEFSDNAALQRAHAAMSSPPDDDYLLRGALEAAAREKKRASSSESSRLTDPNNYLTLTLPSQLVNRAVQPVQSVVSVGARNGADRHESASAQNFVTMGDKQIPLFLFEDEDAADPPLLEEFESTLPHSVAATAGSIAHTVENNNAMDLQRFNSYVQSILASQTGDSDGSDEEESEEAVGHSEQKRSDQKAERRESPLRIETTSVPADDETYTVDSDYAAKQSQQLPQQQQQQQQQQQNLTAQAPPTLLSDVFSRAMQSSAADSRSQQLVPPLESRSSGITYEPVAQQQPTPALTVTAPTVPTTTSTIAATTAAEDSSSLASPRSAAVTSFLERVNQRRALSKASAPSVLPAAPVSTSSAPLNTSSATRLDAKVLSIPVTTAAPAVHHGFIDLADLMGDDDEDDEEED